MNQPEAGITRKMVRRRRTRRHRRNRLYRRIFGSVLLATLTLGISAGILLQLGPSIFGSKAARVPSREETEASRTRLLQTEEAVEHQSRTAGRPVYPYSIVAGGIEDARELKWVAEHDPVVAAHYAGFDFDHARIVRLALAKTVYVSYRIGNHVYWTHKRVKLRKGEKLITDGKMTGRARCGNRVEEVPQQATSASEPPAVRLDKPMPMPETAKDPALPFESALLSRPGVPEIEPGPPSSMYSPFYGGNFVPLAPPPLAAVGVCGPLNKKKKTTDGGITPVVLSTDKKGKGKLGPCGSPGVVPEPGTFLMVGLGFCGLYWLGRRRFASA